MVDKKVWIGVERALSDGLRDTYSAAVLFIMEGGRIAYKKAFGKSYGSDSQEINEDAVFDVASITKAVCTVTVVVSLVGDSRLSLEKRIEDFFEPSSLAQGLGDATIEDILSHSSGLRDYVPFFRKAFEKGDDFVGTDQCRKFMFESARKEPLAYKRNERSLYSDLGFMILTEIIEKVAGERFDVLCNKTFKRLSMERSSFVPWREKEAQKIFGAAELVETEYYEWLKAKARGVVHDENCYAMGGVSGHAGLFTTAPDLARFCAEILKGMEGRSRIFPRELAQRFFQRRKLPVDSTWALGWDTPTEAKSQSGRHFSKNSIGHLGYTGCSVWIDLDKKISVIFLSNRVSRGRDGAAIKRLRPRLHDLVMEALGVR